MSLPLNHLEHEKLLHDKRNSLLYWYPKIGQLNIPVPKTEWVAIPFEAYSELFDGRIKNFKPYLKQIQKKAEGIGFPVFIRSDVASHKHNWENSAFVRRKEDLLPHIIDTLEHNECVGVMGLNIKAIVIREFLELDWRFKAFYGNMPIAKERRYFVKDGKVLCHHPYWYFEAIAKAHEHDGKIFLTTYMPHKLPNKWQQLLAELNQETEEEVKLLMEYSNQVASVFEGFWSADFAYTREGKWYLIDMALGEVSEHYPKCTYAKIGVVKS